MHEQIVGRNPVRELLLRGNPRAVETLWIAEGNSHPRIRQIIQLAERNGVRYQRCNRRHLDALEPELPHQGVIATVSRTRYQELPTILAKSQRQHKPALFVMLDSVQDPRNLGAILRTAEATNVDAVLIPKNRAAAVTAAVHKASAGASHYVPIAKVTNVARTLETLQAAGVWIVGAAEDAELAYTDADLTVPVCLVLGSESDGIRRLVKQKCDSLVRLPMFGQIASLNVSVAAGVLLYEVLRQRGATVASTPRAG